MIILFFTLPGLFCLGLLYWGIIIGFKLLCIIVKPFVELGLINPTQNNHPIITNKSEETWTEKHNRLERERQHREYLEEQRKVNELRAALNDTMKNF